MTSPCIASCTWHHHSANASSTWCHRVQQASLSLAGRPTPIATETAILNIPIYTAALRQPHTHTYILLYSTCRSVQGQPSHATDALLTPAILYIPIYTAALRQPHTYMIKTYPLPINTTLTYLSTGQHGRNLRRMGGYGGTLTRYLAKSRKPKTDQSRPITT